MEKVVIIGSGAAGLTAAIYAARANLEPLVIEGMEPGGQLTTTNDVENYPGFPDGIDGPGLMAHMHAQAERFGTKFQFGEVVKADLLERPFKLTITGDEIIEAQTLIIPPARRRSISALNPSKNLRVAVCRPAPPATARSTAMYPSWWSAAAIPPARRPCS